MLRDITQTSQVPALFCLDRDSEEKMVIRRKNGWELRLRRSNYEMRDETL